MICKSWPLVVVLRVADDETFLPWRYAITMSIIGDTAYAHAAKTAPTPSEWRAIRDELRRMGIKRVRWLRLKSGWREVTI